jgi:hypothetical protein
MSLDAMLESALGGWHSDCGSGFERWQVVPGNTTVDNSPELLVLRFI